MRKIDLMMLQNVLTMFLVAILFFVLIIQIIELFANLNRYITNNVPFSQVLIIQLLYIPKSISYALPIALLFSISFSMGVLYSNNELVAILGAGISFIRLVFPIIIMGLLFSVASFFFEDTLVIPMTRKKMNLSDSVLNISRSFSNADITIIGSGGRVVYLADYYNDAAKSLTNVLVIIRAADGTFQERIQGRSAKWTGTNWRILNASVFNFDENGRLTHHQNTDYENPILSADPDTFQRKTQNIDDLTIQEARERVVSLRAAGLPYRGAETEYFERIAFSITPFIVGLLSCAIGGRLKKNILLLSLLISLSISVLYFVIQMLLRLLATMGQLPPMAGAFGGAFLFFILGSFLMYTAKT